MSNFYFYNECGQLLHVCETIATGIETVRSFTGLELTRDSFLKRVSSKTAIVYKDGVQQKYLFVGADHIRGMHSIVNRGFQLPSNDLFENWWFNTGSGINPRKREETQDFAKRICKKFYQDIVV